MFHNSRAVPPDKNDSQELAQPRVRPQPLLSEELLIDLALGVLIGDAQGLPYDGLNPCEILSYPHRNLQFEDPSINAFLQGSSLAPGTSSDETLFTATVAESLIEAGGFTIDSMVSWHLKALDAPRVGWGFQTLKALEALQEGASPTECGRLLGPEYRTGNGVVMKLSFLSAYFYLCEIGEDTQHQNLFSLLSLTHLSQMSTAAAFAHNAALLYCLEVSHEEFSASEFLERIVSAARKGEQYCNYGAGTRLLSERFATLNTYEGFQEPSMYAASFGVPDSNVYNCLHVIYCAFLNGLKGNYNPFEMMAYMLRFGGNTDANVSMMGSLVCALCGGRGTFLESLPGELLAGVDKREEMTQLAKRFYARFGTKDFDAPLCGKS